MADSMILDLVYNTVIWVRSTWVIASFVLFMTKILGLNRDLGWIHGVRRLWAELRPFYLPAYLYWSSTLIMQGEAWGWNTWNIFAGLLCWYLYKDIDEDDRWKRRKARVTEKIKRMGSRLVIVPVRR